MTNSASSRRSQVGLLLLQRYFTVVGGEYVINTFFTGWYTCTVNEPVRIVLHGTLQYAVEYGRHC